MSCRNNDFYKLSSDVLRGKVNTSSQPDVLSRAFVLETYPTDGGYSSLVFGSMDLMGSAIHGFNSQGLAVDSQVADEAGTGNPGFKPVGGRNSGIQIFGATRMILDSCRSIDEAKITMLNNRIYQFFPAQHFMIYDKYGNSTIAELPGNIDKQGDGSVHFTDYSGEISVMTNHPVYMCPTMECVNKYIKEANPPVTCYYDSIMRYKTLEDIISNHTGKFTPEDMLDTLSLVYETITGGSPTGGDVQDYIKSRTTENWLVDLTDGTLKIRCYLRDGWTNPLDNQKWYCPEEPEGPIIFSPFFNFTLEK